MAHVDSGLPYRVRLCQKEGKRYYGPIGIT